MDKITLRNLIAGAETETSLDCLGVIVASYFESRPECPDEPVDDELGWKPWVMEKTDELLEDAANRIILLGDPVTRTTESNQAK
tara:strand:+ start:9415 stop:9666 length:252 start_codon:yes stop_codon:yes gene_type:complete